jgi:hypothetical protein
MHTSPLALHQPSLLTAPQLLLKLLFLDRSLELLNEGLILFERLFLLEELVMGLAGERSRLRGLAGLVRGAKGERGFAILISEGRVGGACDTGGLITARGTEVVRTFT